MRRCVVAFRMIPGNREIPGWSVASPVDFVLIQVTFTAHRIVSHDEKAYRFLNIFQLKRQSFVTLSSASRCPFAPGYHPLSPFSPFFRPEAVDPFYFWLLPFIKREEAEGKKKKSVYRFFSHNYFAAFCSIKN